MTRVGLARTRARAAHVLAHAPTILFKQRTFTTNTAAVLVTVVHQSFAKRHTGHQMTCHPCDDKGAIVNISHAAESPAGFASGGHRGSNAWPKIGSPPPLMVIGNAISITFIFTSRPAENLNDKTQNLGHMTTPRLFCSAAAKTRSGMYRCAARLDSKAQTMRHWTTTVFASFRITSPPLGLPASKLQAIDRPWRGQQSSPPSRAITSPRTPAFILEGGSHSSGIDCRRLSARYPYAPLHQCFVLILLFSLACSPSARATTVQRVR